MINFLRFQSAVGIELWSMSSDILFDNIVITDDESHATEWAHQTYDLKRKYLDKQAVSTFYKLIFYLNIQISLPLKKKNDKNTIWERMMIHMNYKPGYYLTYFIYCMIPVTIYVCYLWRRYNDDTTEVF